MAINFPSNPNINDTIFYNNTTWKWDGIRWQIVADVGFQGSLGNTGYKGSEGYRGSEGYQGSIGDTGYRGSAGSSGLTIGLLIALGG